jgi:hypothetical protein
VGRSKPDMSIKKAKKAVKKKRVVRRKEGPPTPKPKWPS